MSNDYRSNLIQRGIAMFELSRVSPTVQRMVAGEPLKPGSILEALRRSPLVGADLDLTRIREEGREV